MITKVYEGEEGWLGYSIVEEELYFLHTEITSFSKSRVAKLDSILVNALKEIPAKKVYSQVFSDKAKKFNEFFGFEELGPFNGGTLMELNNVWF